MVKKMSRLLYGIFLDLKQKSREGLFLLILVLIPIQIYIIGDWVGVGIQCSFLRVQNADLGRSIIFITRDINYLITGIYQGKSALSILLEIVAFAFLISTIILFYLEKEITMPLRKRTGGLIILSALFFTASIMAQYGLLFNGPAGVSIPIGIPLFFIIGGWYLSRGSQSPID